MGGRVLLPATHCHQLSASFIRTFEFLPQGPKSCASLEGVSFNHPTPPCLPNSSLIFARTTKVSSTHLPLSGSSRYSQATSPCALTDPDTHRCPALPTHAPLHPTLLNPVTLPYRPAGHCWQSDPLPPTPYHPTGQGSPLPLVPPASAVHPLPGKATQGMHGASTEDPEAL